MKAPIHYLVTVLLVVGIGPAFGRSLSLKEAVSIALSETGNTRARLAAETVRELKAGSAQARSALLPHLEGTVGEEVQTRNLEAFGLRPTAQFRPPTLVGPFSIFDARAYLTQTLFDFSALRRFQASRAGVEAAEIGKQDTEEGVGAETARLYILAQGSQARLDAARAHVKLAEELLRLARDQKQAGTGTGLDVTRAEVQLAREGHNLLTTEFQHRQDLLRLLEFIGLDLNDSVQLEPLSYTPPPDSRLETALEKALTSRSDLQAQLKQQQKSELEYSAASSERFPSLLGFGNYGAIGSGPNDSIPTWLVGISLKLPIFEGGALEARRAEQASKLRQQRLHTEALRRQIELEVRLALGALHLAQQQLEVARQALQLAQDELGHAQRRHHSGVSTSLEIIEAQTRLEGAHHGHISALADYSLARVNLAQAMGTVRETIIQ